MKTKEFTNLLRQIHNGDTGALEPIYNEYYEKMVTAAYFILRNETEAQDAASAVILKILQMAKRNENIYVEDVGGYMSKAITNAAIDIYNKNSVFSDTNPYNQDGVDFDEAATLDYMTVGHALSELSAEERDIATMFFLYDCKMETISKSLGIPISTIKWRIGKARHKLKEMLKHNI